MKRPLLPLFTLLAALVFAAPSFAQYTNGGNDETSEDHTVATSWGPNAAATPGVVVGATGTHLLITEVGMRGLNSAVLTDSTEFVEIYNPTGASIDLSKFYLADVNSYSTLPVAGTVDLAANNTDFAFRFPTGSSIAAGAVKVIAIDGGRYRRGTGVDADYMLFNAGGGATTAQIMTDVGTNKGGVYPGFGSFTNGGEFVWLFFWSGACDLTVDVDLVYWPAAPATGANAPVRKLTTTCQDGPDAGAATSCFFNDAGNPAGSFARGLAVPANGAGTRQRIGAESEAIVSGGNGIAPLTPTSTTVSSDNNPSSFGGKINFTAAISPAGATGTVEFFDGASSLGTATVTAGSATISVTSLSVGSHQITAVYSGDCSFAASTSPPLKQDVNSVQASTAITLTVAPAGSSVCGEKVTLTATLVQTTAPVGVVSNALVTFRDFGVPIGSSMTDVTGQATLSITTLAPGMHSLTATYAGDPSHAASTSNTVVHDVLPAMSTTTLTQSSASTACGEKFILTATVAGAPNPSGDIEFFDGATSLAIVTVDGNGQATLSISTLGFGTHSLTAHYHSDPCNSKSDSNKLLHEVTAAPTSVTLDAAPKLPCGQDLFLEASTTVNDGTIDFYDGATLLGSVPFSGSGASVTLLVPGGLSPGIHSLTATLTPSDPCFAPSTSNKVVHEVNANSTTTSLDSSPNPSVCGEKVILTATVLIGGSGLVVNAGPDGEVNFFDGGIQIGSATLVDGTATLSYVFSSAGSHSLTAVYKGSPCHATSTSGKLVHEVNSVPTTTTLASSPNPSVCGEKVTLTANVDPAAATGEVNFFDGGNAIGAATLSGGVATLSIFPGLGTHSFTAVYKGAGCYAPSNSNTVDHVVQPIPTSVTLTSAPNPSFSTEKVVLVATVDPSAAEGEVNFFDSATQIGSATLVSGVAVLSVPGFTVGTHSLTAVYKGGGCYAPGTSNKVLQVVDDATPVQLTQFRAEPLAGGVELRWQLSDAGSIASVGVERSVSEAGPWSVVTSDVRFEGDVTVASDMNAAAGKTYWYRLVVTLSAGGSRTFGPIAGTAGVGVTEFALARVAPNPSFGQTTIDYTVARASRVRLTVIDLQGREVALLASGEMSPGRYHASWNGRTERGQAPAGLYFIRYQTPVKTHMSKLVLNR